MRSLLYIFIAVLAAGMPVAGIRDLEERAERGDAGAICGLRDSAAVGNARAMNYLGFLYWQGLGTRHDADSAIYFLRKAADLGDAKALGNLGHLMLIGSEKLPVDSAEGIRLLDVAVEGRNLAALRELADLLDQTERYDTLCPGGIKKIADAYSHGYPLKYDYKKSIRYYWRAAQAGDSVSSRIIDETTQMFPDILRECLN